MTTIRVVARAVARPEGRKQLQDALLACVPPTRKDPGCLRYDVTQSTTDPNEFVVLEEWRSEHDIEAHMRTTHVVALLAKVPALVTAPPEIKSYKVIG
ncbi:MAG TPA: putative quinol monooxygenase [Planctomycetota bacterium]|nr:putative quinol monooxygenase [Planctomycetota bacterium]